MRLQEEKSDTAREGEPEGEEASQRGWFFCGRRQSGAETVERRAPAETIGRGEEPAVGVSWRAPSGSEGAEQR